MRLYEFLLTDLFEFSFFSNEEGSAYKLKLPTLSKYFSIKIKEFQE